ncbi:2-nitropropane dioxygenase [Cylindrobasidium torrendii FP15055 ss-10]|uniref:2-nitropropane dioxygenase n=1 Tax=Cylindrobasidium torrendii FP15055 ss-10 TaxID=1314674 RepID=A0A0D7B2Y4_9AGAR|nr:2-nitropropane dioxygenase [Cylindrobasidium torrendii FP15055 ss-10]
MSLISTKLTKLLGIQVPIILPPMAKVDHPELLNVLTRSGAFGFMGAGYMTAPTLSKHLQRIRQVMGIGSSLPLPIGIGYICWQLEQSTAEVTPDPCITAGLKEGVRAVWLAFGEHIGRYVKQVRSVSPKTYIFVLVNSVEEAVRATYEYKADVLVVQGREAGGHGAADALPLSQIFVAVRRAIPLDGPILVAAGGITTGAHTASMLTLGADGVVMGTRFLMTPESGYSDMKKDILLKAGLNASTKSTAFDESISSPWPKTITGRGITNGIIRDAEGGLSLDERVANARKDAEEGKMDRTIVWTGTGSGLITELNPATDVLQEIKEDTIRALKNASSLL